jgi:hypothetical protein
VIVAAENVNLTSSHQTCIAGGSALILVSSRKYSVPGHQSAFHIDAMHEPCLAFGINIFTLVV